MVNWKGALVLLVVLVGLGIYVYATRNPSSTTHGSARFIPCDSTNALELKVEGKSSGLDLVRASVSAGWQISQANPAPADSTQVNQAADSLGAASVVDTLSTPGELAQYGLATPALVVTCRVKDGNSYTLSLGDQSFDASGHYAQKSGDARVYVISGDEVDRFKAFLAQPPLSPTPSP